MSDIRVIGIVGGGVIGAGWAARFLVNGYDAVVYDPDPQLGRKLEAVLANARHAQAELFSGLYLTEGRLTVAPTLVDAVSQADFVVESLPEVEELKIRVLAEIDAAARPDVVIASSTSGLLPSRLQARMAHPERLVVGHPFNPVYLLPLVEVCGGKGTSQGAKDVATALYERIGMRPLQVRKEVDGFIADRLLEALWREALWLVNDGVATTAEIDDAVRYGAGLRWSCMGTFLIYRLAGGEAGMRHFLAQFGPALKLPWTRLEAPVLTETLIDRVSQQSDEQAAGVSIRELERRRDDCLIAVLGGLRSQEYGAGQVLAQYEKMLMERLGTGSETEPDGEDLLGLWSGTVPTAWIDYNGHMTESRYLQCFAETTDALLRRLGLDATYLGDGHSFFTVETHLMHLGQAKLGDRLRVTTQVLGGDGKRLHVFHSLLRGSEAVASAEQMLLHVDTRTDKVVSAQGAMAVAIADLVAMHADLPKPETAGRAVGVRRAG